MKENVMALSINGNLRTEYEKKTKRLLDYQEMRDLVCLYYGEPWSDIFQKYYNKEILNSLKIAVSAVIKSIANINDEEKYIENDTETDFSGKTTNYPNDFGIRLFNFIQSKIYQKTVFLSDKKDLQEQDDEKIRIYNKYDIELGNE